MKLVWLSDLHMDMVSYQQQILFWEKLHDVRADALVITGDIANATSLGSYLEKFALNFPKPIYLCLGNHDYYQSSISVVDQHIDEICSEFPNLHHLGKGEIIKLSNDTAMIGHHGWADGRAGSGIMSPVRMNDFTHIGDFSICSDKKAIWDKMQKLGQESAEYFEKILPQALERYNHVIIATHVPPFPEAVKHNGLLSSPDYLPLFCNLSAGEAIRNVASGFENRKVTILCGHTHSAAFYQDKGITCHVAPAEYGNPQIANILEIE